MDPARTILDVGFSPEGWDSLPDQFAGTVLSSQLVAFSEFGLPPNLLSLLQQLNDTHLIHHNSSVASYPLSEGLKGLVDGIDWWRVSDGWLREDSPSDKLPPWGVAVLNAIDYTQRFDSLESFITAYQTGVAVDALKAAIVHTIDDHPISTASAKEDASSRRVADVPLPRTIVTPPERSKEPIAIVGMGCRLPRANSITELETLLRNGTYAIQEVPIDRWDPTLFWDSDPKATGQNLQQDRWFY